MTRVMRKGATGSALVAGSAALAAWRANDAVSWLQTSTIRMSQAHFLVFNRPLPMLFDLHLALLANLSEAATWFLTFGAQLVA